MKFKTTYIHSLSAYNNYLKGVQGQLSLPELRDVNKLFRKVREEVLIDTENAMNIKRQDYVKIQNESVNEKDEKKKTELQAKLRAIEKEFEVMQNKEIEVEVMKEGLLAFKKIYEGTKVEHLEQVSKDGKKDRDVATILNFENFYDEVESSLSEIK